eukprot:TRINITY_DN5548_c0_g1_i4.p1 TRINITY_DN5548_c0_g1~~TRINITY_DN5548_c0_g1_i4.p1  ORF type:complete len:485 (+),score=165.01 TRINITY_DN5548_c0_g1_i4:102-1556(+)
MLQIAVFFFFLMIRRPPRSTLSSSSAASDVYKRQENKWLARSISELEARAGQKDSHDKLLKEVHGTYVKVRRELVQPVAREYVCKVCREQQLPDALLECSAYLARMSADEFEIVGAIFRTDGAASVLSSFLRLLEAMWDVLHDTARPIIIAQVDLDALCRVLEVLTLEVPELLEHMHPTVCTLLTPVLDRLAQDAQERLIYRAQSFMVAKIGSFYPLPAHLQYPALLDNPDIKDTWYPTLVCTLDLLSKVWRCLKKEIFEGLAQEAISLCIQSFVTAAKTISRQSTKLDSELFLIKHLNTLREQTLPFEGLDYEMNDVALDFKSLQHGLAKLFTSQGSSLFTWGTGNLFLQSVRTKQTTYNPKQQLETKLREACERFILLVTEEVGAPLIELSSKIQNNPPSQEEVDGVVAKANKQLNNFLVPLVQKIKKYCEGTPNLLGTVLGPIKQSLVQVVERLHSDITSGQDVPMCASLQNHLALAQAIS